MVEVNRRVTGSSPVGGASPQLTGLITPASKITHPQSTSFSTSPRHAGRCLQVAQPDDRALPDLMTSDDRTDNAEHANGPGERVAAARRRREQIEERIEQLRDRRGEIEQQRTEGHGSPIEAAAEAQARAERAHEHAAEAHQRAAVQHEESAEVHEHVADVLDEYGRTDNAQTHRRSAELAREAGDEEHRTAAEES
ncbi:hypothetical protein GCM10010472_64480 [Pseudonocardia halophobica]|uniref:Uncharacterized protein n=2 Tax=Pseudonocardia halophobica TaxID=29401 RepID=A0A9W6UFC6_9PSEU|nr:hypothetical protein GCM10017577_66690 [Pseudonocardia halophobica]